MNIKEYFENKTGVGILSTSDRDGKPNLAIYSRPHVMEDGTIAFIMLERLTHANIQKNPYAAYLFIETENVSIKIKGVRLYITMLREEKNSEKLHKLRRVKYNDDTNKTRYLVFFKITKILPLVGDDETNIPFTL
jgi:hypothetical protein